MRLVTADAHRGLVAAIGATLPAASWQRCRYAANLMSAYPEPSWPWVKSLLHSVYDPPDAAAVTARFDRILDALTLKLPAVVDHLEAARPDLLVFTAFPKKRWPQIGPNNPQELSGTDCPRQQWCSLALRGQWAPQEVPELSTFRFCPVQ